MKDEKIISEINNVEFDSEGNPVYSAEQIKSAMEKQAIGFAEWKDKNYYSIGGEKWVRGGDFPNDEYVALEIKDLYKPYNEAE